MNITVNITFIVVPLYYDVKMQFVRSLENSQLKEFYIRLYLYEYFYKSRSLSNSFKINPIPCHSSKQCKNVDTAVTSRKAVNKTRESEQHNCGCNWKLLWFILAKSSAVVGRDRRVRVGRSFFESRLPSEGKRRGKMFCLNSFAVARRGLLIIFNNPSGIVRASRGVVSPEYFLLVSKYSPLPSPAESKLGEWSWIQLTLFKHSRSQRFLCTS